jgi:N-methylhydantoinase A
MLALEHIPEDRMQFVRQLDLRFHGQSYELTIPVPNTPQAIDVPALSDAFCAMHRKVYGYAPADEPTELVNIRATAVGSVRRPAQRRVERGSADSRPARKSPREVFFAETGGNVVCEAYDRYRLLAGNRVVGPAIIEEKDATTVVHPGYQAEVDPCGNLLIEEART